MPRPLDRLLCWALVPLALATALGCGEPQTAPAHPVWSDVAPVLRGACVSCHGWTATDRPADAAGVHPPNTGGSIRLDFFDVTEEVCGHAAYALDPTVSLAGSPAAYARMGADVLAQPGARWPRMPPQPTPALPDWEIETITRWASDPVKGPPPAGNRPPSITVSQLPAAIDGRLAFTAIIDDPDGDGVLGVVEIGGVAFLMNRPGSFAVDLDSSAWPAGTVHPIGVVCDGWTRSTVDLGPVEVRH